ncbi:LysE family translocator [Comamonas sp. GB3 AK4-5]|uniref:LysE family translocator n=1 Tax=Comamonas sp. GB3 AK4-5 TaxID=3231487 RepID=UPI00351E9264
MASFALVGAITPGPVNVLALRHGSQGAQRQALLYVLGASLSYVGVVATMGLGATQLQQLLPRLARSGQWLCAAYLLWLAWKLARAPVGPQTSDPDQAPPSSWQAFGQGVAVQTLNPKAWLFALSAVGVFVLPHASTPLTALGLLCAVSLLACLLGVGCWAVLGRALVRWLTSARRQRALHGLLAALLVGSVLGMLA